jgi:dipeptidyl-peptidase-4
MKKTLMSIKTLLLANLLVWATLTEGVAQTTKTLTVDDIWGRSKFRTESSPGFNFLKDGKHYAMFEKGYILRMDFTTGQPNGAIFEPSMVKNNPSFRFDNYSFSDDEQKILFETESENIYRHSSKCMYYVWDGKNLESLYPTAKQSNPKFNPQGDKVAFTSNNNLFVKDLSNGKITQITKDGAKNSIINGLCDWVYEEEFGFTRAYEWSPDGSKIAFLRFDESNVKEFTMQLYHDEAYPQNETFKYPKVGEKNSVVTVWLYEVGDRKAKQIEVQSEYFPRLQWTPDNQLCVFKLNRHQNELTLLLVNAKRDTSVLYKEKNKAYLEIEDNTLTFLPHNQGFIWLSEQTGWRHLFHIDMKGNIVKELTKGNYDVTELLGFDAKRQIVYYQAAKNSALTRQVYGLNLLNGEEKVICGERGSNVVQFNPTFDYYVHISSTINKPAVAAVFDLHENRKLRTLYENKVLQKQQEEYSVSEIEFFSFKTTEGVELNGWMIKPKNFEPTKKYPVFMTQYSGPGSQQVLDRWRGQDYWWYQLLAQKGYIVACVDPRGTGARGEEFKKITYLQLGHYETIDQIEAAKHLGSLPYVDKNRIGIFGWSYGGYMSSLCILKGNETFKAAIAVAPVTNWKWYDSVYTERYMQTEKENAKGYKENSPVYFADRLKGNYLLVHGLADDNVHFQNAMEMTNALIKANKHFDNYYYPNKNHGIYGGNTRLHLYTKILNFILEKL